MMLLAMVLAATPGRDSMAELLGAIAIFVGTFIVEDAATISAALAASQNLLPTWIAASSLYAGIILGDFALYGLGSAAARHQRLRAWVGEHRIAAGSEWMRGRMVRVLVGARFVPGMRLPTFTASGYLGVGFLRFALITAIASAIWTTILFSLIYWLGENVLPQLGIWKWPVAAGIILFALALILVTGRASRKRASTGADENT